MHAAKHFDPQLGIDIHLYVFPPIPTPIPLPTPHIGIVLDPFDYLPIIGGTIRVNGVKRATAGTGGLDIHIPLGPWMPTLKMPGGPQFEDELFMGSMTVVADGDPLSRIGMPVLDCNIVGLINPFRIKKPKKPQLSMSLPTAVNLAIPNTVNVGGPPMISIMGMAFRGLFAGLGRLRKTQAFQKAMDKFRDFRRARFANLPPGLLKCKVLRAEPVDIRRGSVEVTHEDFAIPGRLPLAWTRRYSSSNAHRGACGHGWETPADIRLEITPEGPVLFQPPDGAFAVFSQLPASAFDDAEPAWSSGARLARVVGGQGSELQVRTNDDLVYVFKAPPANLAPLRAPLSIEIERIEDLCGNHWRFERVDGRLVRIVESGIGAGIGGLQGRFLSIEQHAGLIHHIALHDPASGETYPLVRYRFDEATADLIAAHDALDAARTFAYRADHRMLRHTDRTGLSFHYAWGSGEDDAGRVVHAWGDGGLHDYRFAYSRLLRETEVTDSLGHVSLVKFDANDLPLCEIDPLGGVTVFEYDEAGRTTAIIDPAGLRTGFEYDERGNVLRLALPDDSVVCSAYDERGAPTEITDATGAVWSQQWNERGQLVEQRSPMGAVSRYAYDATGLPSTHTDPRGGVTRFAFDRHGLLASVTDALGARTLFRHDALGRLLQQTDALGQATHYRHDAKGRVLELRLPHGASIRCAYDGEDQLVRHVDEAGHETRLTYAGTGQVIQRVQPDGHSLRYLYDTEEQLIGVVNQRNETFSLRRDALGRIVEETDYWGQSRRYGYSANGHLRHTIDPLGQVVTFECDKLGRIVKKLLPEPRQDGGQRQETFRYDRAGRLIEMRNADAHVTRRFDSGGQLLVEEQNGFKIEHAYSPAGERIRRTTSAGNTLEVAHDLCGRPCRIAINDEPPIAIERDALGRPVSEQLGAQLRRTLAYNAQGLLSAQSVARDHAALFDTRYDYDHAGNLVRRSDSAHGATRFAYDPIGRVLEQTDPAGRLTQWLSDPAGDRLRTRVRETEMRRIAGDDGATPVDWSREGEFDGVHYRFDRAGNLTQRRHSNESGAPTLQLAWDASRRLIESRWRGGARDGQVTTYGYDPLGRRVVKRNATYTTWFYWDGDALVAELRLTHAQAEEAMTSAATRAGGAGQGAVLDFSAARRRMQALKALHPQAREYVHRPGGVEPLALIDPRTGTPQRAREPRVAASDPPPPAAPIRQDAPSAAMGSLGAVALGGGAAVVPGVAGSTAPASIPAGSGGLGQGALLGSPRPQPAAPAVEPIAPTPSVAASEVGPLPSEGRLLLYHLDPNGSPTRLTDSAGRVVWSASYAAWGATLAHEPLGVDQPLRLQGQQHDEETGLHYNRHRYFDPGIGQFVTQDPLGLAPGPALYEFGVNTTGWADPTGLACQRLSGNTQLDRVAREIDAAVSHADRMLARGLHGSTPWGRIYQGILRRDPNHWLLPLARGNAIQQIADQSLRNNRYLRDAGVVFNSGHLGGARSASGHLLRPDYQMPLSGDRLGIIDITTPGQGPKISKYKPGSWTNVFY